MVTLLPSERIADLQSADLTYADIGATLSGIAPPGYRAFERSNVLHGVAFEDAVDRLMTWRVHERAGLRVAASSPRAREGDVVVMSLGRGPATLRIPCRVIHAVEGATNAGFAYGTLPGHPESGEEIFCIERHPEGAVMRIRAFSRPGGMLARLSGPIGRHIQQRMTARYLRAAGDQ